MSNIVPLRPQPRPDILVAIKRLAAVYSAGRMPCEMAVREYCRSLAVLTPEELERAVDRIIDTRLKFLPTPAEIRAEVPEAPSRSAAELAEFMHRLRCRNYRPGGLWLPEWGPRPEEREEHAAD